MGTRRLYWEDSPFVQFVKENEGEEAIEENQLIANFKSPLTEELVNNSEDNLSDTSDGHKRSNAMIDNRKISQKIRDFFSVEYLLRENFNKSYQELIELYDNRTKMIIKAILILLVLIGFVVLVADNRLAYFLETFIIIVGTMIFLRLNSIKSKIENLKIIIRFTHQTDLKYENMINKVIKYLREFELVWRGQRIGSKRPPREIENHVIHKDKTMTDYCFMELRRNLKDNLIRLTRVINPQPERHESDDDDGYNLYEIQKDFDGYLNVIQQKRVEARMLLRKFSVGVLENKKFINLGKEINTILSAKDRELKDLQVSFQEVKNVMKPDEKETSKFDVTMNYLQTMLNNYKTLKRNLQTIIKSDLKEKTQLKSQIKYLSELEKTIFAENQIIDSKILEEIAIRRKRSTNEDGQEEEEDQSSELSGSDSDQYEGEEDSGPEEEYLKVYEADANDYDEPVPRRNNEETAYEKSTKLFRPVMAELADTIKTRKIKHKAKHFKKAEDGKYKEIQKQANELADKTASEEKKEEDKPQKQEYKIERMDFGDFKMSMKDVFKELQLKKNEN